MELLEFIFRDIWHFIGTVILLTICTEILPSAIVRVNHYHTKE